MRRARRRIGRALPSRMYLSSVFLLFLYVLPFSEDEGRELGTSHYDCASCFGVGKGYLKKPAVVREGSGKPLPWSFGPHVAGSR